MSAAAQPPHVWILSARFGLIPGSQPVPDYDHRMEPSDVSALRPVLRGQLAAELESANVDSLFVSAGKTYEAALALALDSIPQSVKVRRASGSIGGRAGQLREWLLGAASINRSGRTSSAVLRLAPLHVTPASLPELAEELIEADPSGASRYQTWCVVIGEQRVAPKWLASVITRVPVSRFRTSDAIDFLELLGLRVERAPTRG